MEKTLPLRLETVKNWDDFELKLQKLHAGREQYIKEPGDYASPLLFRGQADARWELESTLEREISGTKLVDYYRVIHASKPNIESFTSHTWDIPSYEQYSNDSCNGDLLSLHKLFSSAPIYEYMAYLRHSGFPSPLLDWTASPYIAAFFAFNDVKKDTEEVAIYAYLESTGFKITSGGNNEPPHINQLGPYVRTHKRHFLQQSQYTVCCGWKNNELCYGSHEEAFENSSGGQDIRWKFTLPSKERSAFLEKLELMNINAFSLFASEESLISMLGRRGIKKLLDKTF